MRSAASALTLEPDDAPVSSNEALENTVAAFRADVAALRNEVLVGTTRIDQDIRELRARTRACLVITFVNEAR